LNGVDIFDNEWIIELFEYIDFEFDIFDLGFIDDNLFDGNKSAFGHIYSFINDTISSFT